jgi:hypothetical protein
MSRSRHPKKEVEQALQYAEARGCTIVESHRGHRWGEVLAAAPDGAAFGVWATPKNPGNHAKDIRRFADQRGLPVE